VGKKETEKRETKRRRRQRNDEIKEKAGEDYVGAQQVRRTLRLRPQLGLGNDHVAARYSAPVFCIAFSPIAGVAGMAIWLK
jgi:hypothetical protein